MKTTMKKSSKMLAIAAMSAAILLTASACNNANDNGVNDNVTNPPTATADPAATNGVTDETMAP